MVGSSMCSLTPLCWRRCRICWSCIATTCVMISLERGLNIIISSMRLRNSGRIDLLSSAKTSFLVFSSVACTSFLSSPAKCSWISWAPRLVVMMTIVFLKLATRPLLSVSRPSSSTCSSVLNTSGCAFSISSSSTTA